MAVDRKADHIGNHGGVYTDNDGMSKQFTYVDHDKKTTIGVPNSPVDKNWLQDYRLNLKERILDQPASICPEYYSDFTIRGEGKTHIEWNTKMLSDNGVPLDRLRTLCVQLENKAELMGLIPQVKNT